MILRKQTKSWSRRLLQCSSVLQGTVWRKANTRGSLFLYLVLPLFRTLWCVVFICLFFLLFHFIVYVFSIFRSCRLLYSFLVYFISVYLRVCLFCWFYTFSFLPIFYLFCFTVHVCSLFLLIPLFTHFNSLFICFPFGVCLFTSLYFHLSLRSVLFFHLSSSPTIRFCLIYFVSFVLVSMCPFSRSLSVCLFPLLIILRSDIASSLCHSVILFHILFICVFF